MLLRRVSVENVRSFLARADLGLEGAISILIGPNGGGKTNLLDISVTMLRRYLFASRYAVPAPIPEMPQRFEFRDNDALNNMTLERHSNGTGKPQIVEIEVEVTQSDIDNISAMRKDAPELNKRALTRYVNTQIERATNWKAEDFSKGERFQYRWADGRLDGVGGKPGQFQEYLNNFEVDSLLRTEFGLAPLSTPMIYLPVTRSQNAFQSSIELAGYNDFEQKRQIDATISRSVTSIVPLAVGRLAQKYRLLLERDSGRARADFKEDENLKELSNLLSELGYEWDLESTNPLKNAYDIRLKKQGSTFFVGAASSGERELLTYLFAIFALNVRDALIVVDEPELHLHPTWQKELLALFARLSNTTGNQFLLATHSPTFISPASIHYVSRVFSRQQQSHVHRLTPDQLPNAKHLLNIVNSQNNEAIFFADFVVLVEGISDRIFFEAVFNRLGLRDRRHQALEFIGVGGKGLFKAYGELLKACQVRYSIIADRDYIEEIGTDGVKRLFKVDENEIKRDVIENPKSSDGKALVERIEEAMTTGNWAGAQNTWAYIKSRRKKLRNDLTDAEKASLVAFMNETRGEGVFLLKEGSLEAYLPDGYKDKDIAKLVKLLSEEDFWPKINTNHRTELEEIARQIAARISQ